MKGDDMIRVTFLVFALLGIMVFSFGCAATTPSALTQPSNDARLEAESNTDSEIHQREARVLSKLRIQRWIDAGASGPTPAPVPAPGLPPGEGDPQSQTVNVYCGEGACWQTDRRETPQTCPPCVETYGLECLPDGQARDPLTGLVFQPGKDCENWERLTTEK